MRIVKGECWGGGHFQWERDGRETHVLLSLSAKGKITHL
jgi:hypothetical protein